MIRFASSTPFSASYQRLPRLEESRLFSTDEKETDGWVCCHIEYDSRNSKIGCIDHACDGDSRKACEWVHQPFRCEGTDGDGSLWISDLVSARDYRPR